MPKRKTTNYTEDFKRSSARLAANSDQSISKIAEELGVHVTTLHGWVKKYESNANKRQQAATTDSLAEELKQLKKENTRLRQERDILKKAAAYFANEVV